MPDQPQLWIRERGLALLFVGALGAAVGFTFLADRAPKAAQVIGVVVIGFLVLLSIQAILRARGRKQGRAPVGPLSRDEKAKARSKLVKPKP